MLHELRVRDLGVIADLSLVLAPGMTAVTGETGTGKTLIVEAIELLVGGRADAVLVRPGATEAWIEGRFQDGDTEVVLARALPAGGGRSRAYIEGRMAQVAGLAEIGRRLVDLHGQHAHQSLLSLPEQRQALDRFGSVDFSLLNDARKKLAAIDEALAALGGDARARERELDLLRFQAAEIAAANLDDPDEEALLEVLEDRLADADAARHAAASAHELLVGDAGAADVVGAAVHQVQERPALAELAVRLRAVASELSDLAADLRKAAESLEADPERLAEVRARRQQIRDLCRKYGDGVEGVIAFGREVAGRVAELKSHSSRVTALEAQWPSAHEAVKRAEAGVSAARKKAAPRLGAAVQERLRALAMQKGRFDITVAGHGPADDVRFMLSANPGEPALPLSKIASGGELARTMLALRLVLGGSPPTVVFDEVDAGIGGEAAVAVGASLAALATNRQVLVVTHLPQVAAFADAQVAVTKSELRGRTVAAATLLDADARVAELSRMLSGQPESTTAREHAEELLATAAHRRGTKRVH